ncbi:hypothetical protein C0J52_27620 [Blattella germanica]|nr:hypothetical protein C0J52_27620 [Blattella germanica]
MHTDNKLHVRTNTSLCSAIQTFNPLIGCKFSAPFQNAKEADEVETNKESCKHGEVPRQVVGFKTIFVQDLLAILETWKIDYRSSGCYLMIENEVSVQVLHHNQKGTVVYKKGIIMVGGRWVTASASKPKYCGFNPGPSCEIIRHSSWECLQNSLMKQLTLENTKLQFDLKSFYEMIVPESCKFSAPFQNAKEADEVETNKESCKHGKVPRQVVGFKTIFVQDLLAILETWKISAVGTFCERL